MPETRRRYDPDFREGAVRVVRETHKPIAHVARDLGIKSGHPPFPWRYRVRRCDARDTTTLRP